MRKTIFSYQIQNNWTLKTASPKYAAELEQLQRKVFPTLSEPEIIKEAQYLRQMEVFPEGQFIVLEGDKLIAQCSTMRYHLSTEHHTFLEVSDHLWIGTHEPNGPWLYGLDMGVDPNYRQQGIARALYRAKQNLVRATDMEGQLIVGMLNDYFQYKEQYSTDDYYRQVLRGTIYDSTVSSQMKIGFRPLRLLNNYLEDAQCGNAGVLMMLEAEKEI